MAPVWPFMHQTAQSAENLGLATLCCFASGMSIPFSECNGAVRLHNMPDADQLAPKQVFAGLRRNAQQAWGFDAMGEAVHTPAHRYDGLIQALPLGERRIALGNQDADRLAKHALSLHPQAAPADLGELDRRVQLLQACAKMFAVSSPLPEAGVQAPA